MKVIHISKSDTGGAGIAAHRLNKAMLEYGIESKLLCLINSKKKDKTVIKYYDSFFHKLLRASQLPFNNYIQNQKTLKKLGGSYEAFSFINTDYFIHNHQNYLK